MPRSSPQLHTPVVQQQQATECGIASLAIVLRHFGYSCHLQQLREETDHGLDGLTLFDLARAAGRRGLRSRILFADTANLPQLELPAIVNVNFLHFVVIEAVHPDRVCLNDPNYGPRQIALPEFDRSFTGFTLSFSAHQPAARPQRHGRPAPLRRFLSPLRPFFSQWVRKVVRRTTTFDPFLLDEYEPETFLEWQDAGFDYLRASLRTLPAVAGLTGGLGVLAFGLWTNFSMLPATAVLLAGFSAALLYQRKRYHSSEEPRILHQHLRFSEQSLFLQFDSVRLRSEEFERTAVLAGRHALWLSREEPARRIRTNALFLFAGATTAAVLFAGNPSGWPALLLCLSAWGLLQPLLRWPAFAQQNTHCRRAADFLALQPRPPDPRLHGDPTATLIVQGLSAGYYRRKEPRLHDLSLKLQPTEFACLQGTDNSGRSTLLKALQGRCHLHHGKIRIHPQTAFLGPFPVLFEGSVRQNLTAFQTGFSDAQLIAALTETGVWDLLAARQGLDTACSDVTERFSGGEQQRIVLARALLRSPRLLLVDEAFDNLDPDAEADVLQRLRRRSLALLLVSNRSDNRHLFDTVYHMNKGHLTPDPSPQPVPASPVRPATNPTPPEPEMPPPDRSALHRLLRYHGHHPAKPRRPAFPPVPHLHPLRSAAWQFGIFLRRVRYLGQQPAPEPHFTTGQKAAAFHPASPPQPESLTAQTFLPVALDPSAPNPPARRSLLYPFLAWMALLIALTGTALALDSPPTAPATSLLIGSWLIASAAAFLLLHQTFPIQLSRYLRPYQWFRMFHFSAPQLRHAFASPRRASFRRFPESTQQTAHAAATASALAALAFSAAVLAGFPPGPTALTGCLLAAGTIAGAWPARRAFARLSRRRYHLKRLRLSLFFGFPHFRSLGLHQSILHHWRHQLRRHPWACLRRDPCFALLDSLILIAPLCLLAWLPLPQTALHLPMAFLALAATAASLRFLFTALCAPVATKDLDGPASSLPETTPEHPSPVPDGGFTVRNLSYRYPNAARPVLKGCSLHLHRGEFLFLTSPSGQGKSTLLKLLLGYDEPLEGSISYSSASGQSLSIAQARPWVRIIFQNTPLPMGPVRHMLSGNLPLSTDRIIEALRTVGLWENIRNLPMGLNTLRADRHFSTAERQQLLIASALLQQPALLILDETLSSLPHSVIRPLLHNLRSRRISVLAVSHRSALARFFDRSVSLNPQSPS